MLLAMFASVVNASEEDEEEEKVEQAADAIVSLAILGALLGIDPSSELKEDTIKDLFKPMDERCCDKCDHNKKEDEPITGFKELDDVLNSIPSDELDKMLKAESEKRKSYSNHEFSDAIAEAALEICGIDLKKKEDQHGHNT